MNKFFGWKIVALAFFLDFCAVGYSFQSFPVIVLELSQEFLESTKTYNKVIKDECLLSIFRILNASFNI